MKRRTIASRCAMYVETQEKQTFLDQHLTVPKDLAKFLTDTRLIEDGDRTLPNEDETQGDDPEVSSEAFSRNYIRSHRSGSRRKNTKDYQRGAV